MKSAIAKRFHFLRNIVNQNGFAVFSLIFFSSIFLISVLNQEYFWFIFLSPFLLFLFKVIPVAKNNFLVVIAGVILYVFMSIYIYNVRFSNFADLVEGESYAISGNITKLNKCENNFCQYILNNVKVNGNNFLGTIMINIYRSELVPLGSEISWTQKFKDVDFKTETFDYKYYLQSNNILAKFSVSKFNYLYFENSDISIAERIRAVEFSAISLENKNILQAIIFGIKTDLDDTFYENLKNTGLTHIIAVSGFNISIAFLFLSIFIGIFHRKKIYILSIIFITFYMAIVGFDNLPALRAYVMGCIALIAHLFGRKVPFWNNLFIAAWVSLLLNPFSLTNISFQLSYLSIVGLKMLSKYWESKFNYLSSFVKDSFVATLSCTFFTLPLTISSFNQMSVIALLANVFVVPVIPIITILGIIIYIFKAIGINLSAIEYIVQVLIEVFKAFANLFGENPYSQLGDLNINIYWIYLIFLLLMFEMSYHNYHKKKI